MAYSVGEVARISRVTIRTLHHYDEIGLLSPSERTSSGYRRYGAADLDRLQRIRWYRELGFALPDIAAMLAAGDGGEFEHLRRQHQLVEQRIEHLHALARSIEKAMEARKMGIRLDPHEMFEVFGDDDPTQYAAETEERWGDTDDYRKSRRRASSYRKDDWLRMRREQSDIEHRLGELMRSGVAPDEPEAMDAAEGHRQHIIRWFYDCTRQMHRNLGEMYVQDERFTQHYEQVAPGLAAYVRDAVRANAERVAGQS